MAEYGPELAYFRLRLGERFAENLVAGQPLPPEAIREVVETGPFPFDIESREQLIRELEHSFTTTQRRGASVRSDYRPWLSQRLSEIDFFYWNRLQRYYLEGNVLPPHVVATLNTVTDEVLDYCGNPADTGAWRRRGMVIGHVQSGKTTNYSSLICKAADAGYKIVILLAGITNSLRAQTQERLDETFIGKKSVFMATVQEPLSIVSYSSEWRFPAYGTSRDRDFSKAAASTHGVSLSALREPIIFVTKKNKATLERLRDWLDEHNQGQRISDPLLLIDDEADNASINTANDPLKVTAINKAIREILNLFDRSSYVGYTATPFANIFIDPDTEHSMLEDDLFPRHFIKALDPPSNYVGAARVFDEEGDLYPVMVREIADYKDLLPLNHKNGHPLDALPPSLHRAMRIFFLARAIRVLRGDGRGHCSMMINVSRFNDVQERVLGHVYAYLEKVRNAATVNAGLHSSTQSDPHLRLLSEEFNSEFSQSGYTFKDVLSVLGQAVATIVTTTVNMRGGALNYSQHKDDGLHVIAIGGLALSRGLTLEGLTVSYILRNTAASDTLMQMARWFGYRPNYEDLCRLYLPQASYDHYEYINKAIEELRGEVNRMEQLGMTPEDFGLRVRQSPTAIRVTAANKMRTATSMTVAQDYSGRHIEGYALFNDDAINSRNLRATESFVEGLGAESKEYPDDSHLIWTDVDGARILGLLRGFKFPVAQGDLGEIGGGSSLFSDYVADRLRADLAKWDVAIPLLKQSTSDDELIFDRSLPLRRREKGTLNSGVYRVYGGKNRVADPDDAKIALTSAQLKAAENGTGKGDSKYCLQRQKPLLLIHYFKTNSKLAETSQEENLRMSDPVVSLSFCMPSTRITPVSRTYQVNTVYRRQLDLFASEPDDDEAFLAGGQDV